MATYKWTGAGTGDNNDQTNWKLDDGTLRFETAVATASVTATQAQPAAPATRGARPDGGEVDSGASYKGTVYYIDSVNGNDKNTGTSPDQAWKTLAQAESKFHIDSWDLAPPNSHTDPPYHDPWTAAPDGSAFLFKRGGTYEGTIEVYPLKSDGTFANNYTFGAYGDSDDPRPVIVNDGKTAVVGHIEGQQFDIRNLHIVNGPDTPSAGAVFINDTNGVHIVNTEINGFDTGMVADHLSNLTIDNVYLHDNKVSYGAGLGVSGDNIKIVDSSFVNNGSNGMFSHDLYLRYLHNAVIENNYIAGAGNLGIVVHGTSDNVVIRGNEITGNNNGLAISGHGSATQTNEVFSNFLIEDNVIHGNGLKAGQQGYGMMIQSLTDSVVRDNVVYDNRLAALTISDALAGDQQSSDISIYNNMFSGLVAINGSKTTDLSFLNNIFTASGSKSESFALKVASSFPSSELTLDHNMYFMPDKANDKVISFYGKAVTVSALASSFGQEVHGLNANPQFVDAAHGDFRLKPSSPAVDKGVNIPGATDDASGAHRPEGTRTDIGPYEYGVQPGTKAPSAPIITSFSMDSGIVADGVITRDNSLKLNGVASANSTVKIYDGGTLLGNAKADANGKWSYTTPGLKDGTHQLATTDASGKASAASNTLDVLVDTTAPTATFNAADLKGTDGSIMLSGKISDNVVAGAVEVFNGKTSLGVATVNNTDHTWSLTAKLSPGTYNQLQIAALDEAGNATSVANSDRLTIEAAGAGLREILRHADGSKEIVVTGITGQKWTATDSIYGTNGKLAEQSWTNGDKVVKTQTWNADGTTHDIHYYGITGQAYTDYDVVYGLKNKPITATYSNGMTQTWVYDDHGSLDRLVTDGITGQKWTSTATIYGDNGRATSMLWSDGDSVVRTQTFNADGSVHAIHYYGITGQAYTEYEVTYGANKKAASIAYSNGMTAEWTYKTDGSYSVAYDHIESKGTTAYTNVYDPGLAANGHLAARETVSANGVQTVRGYESDLTIVKNNDGVHVNLPGPGDDIFHFDFNQNTTITGGGAHTNFVLESGFGNVTLTDFVAHSQPKSDGDVITFGKGLFDNFADLQQHMVQDNKATIINDGHGNTLTLANTQMAHLHANDFILL